MSKNEQARTVRRKIKEHTTGETSISWKAMERGMVKMVTISRAAMPKSQFPLTFPLGFSRHLSFPTTMSFERLLCSEMSASEMLVKAVCRPNMSTSSLRVGV